MSQWIFLEPNDVWMFRDSKPFTAAASFVARSIFPPTPQTVQGAIRTAYLTERGVNLHEFKRGIVDEDIRRVVGVPVREGMAEFGSLRLEGPFVARRTDKGIEQIYPLPLDVLVRREDDRVETRLLTPGTSSIMTNVPFAGWRPLLGGGDQFKEESGWLTEGGFHQWLEGQAPDPNALVDTASIYQIEERVGLGLDHARRANLTGHFYYAQFVRMCDDAGLLVHLNEAILADTGNLHLGGEARTARYQTVQVAALPAAASGSVKVVLLAPAWFEDLYHTDWAPWVGAGARLASVVVGRPQPISGWDVANNRPKPLRNFVPAGSVFFFEDAVWQGNPFTQIPQHELDFGAMGFGSCAVGQW